MANVLTLKAKVQFPKVLIEKLHRVPRNINLLLMGARLIIRGITKDRILEKESLSKKEKMIG